ncbi:MAG: hypothetical protein K8F91_08025 [Candidatus Obscuribacterales bacterium]|nr:hypothetical protein [Candidatus Obscuribacterales bacterium]
MANPQSNDESQLLIQLLRAGGLVSEADVEDFKSIAKELKIPFAQAIINSGLLNERNMHVCIEAHKKVQNREIKADLAIRAVRVAVQKKCSLAAALTSVRKLHQTTRVTVPLANELSNMLLQAGIISQEQLGNLLRKAEESQMMIGHLLVLEGVLEIFEISAALNAVRMVRETDLTRDQAVKGLAHARSQKTTIEQALFELGFFKPPDAKTVRVGEIFTMARVLSRKELAECYEIELFKEKHFGQILVERGLATKAHLEASVALLASISKEMIKPYLAAQALREICKDNAETDTTIEAYEKKSMAESENFRLGDLLVEGGVITREILEQTVNVNPDNAVKVGSRVLKAGLISEGTLFAALRLQTALRLGYLSRDNTLQLLRHCVKEGVSLDRALRELDLYVPSRMQWTWV